MKAAREREHGPTLERAGEQLARMVRHSRARESRNLSVRDSNRLLDVVGQAAEPRSEHDRGDGRRARQTAANGVGRFFLVGGAELGRGCHDAPAAGDVETRGGKPTGSRNWAMRARASASSVSRSLQRANALSKPFSANWHKSSKPKPSSRAACRYSSVSVVPLMSRLSVFSTTFIPRAWYARKGCSSYDSAACVCTLLVRQISSAMRRSFTYCVRDSSSIRCVAWPIRFAPHTCTASRTDSAPAPSPAWQVHARSCVCAYSNAFACFEAGFPASPPARSNPTTPLPLYATASSASSSDCADDSWRSAQTSTLATMPASFWARARPRSGASTAAASESPWWTFRIGAYRTSM